MTETQTHTNGQANTTKDAARRLCLTGVMFTAITDKAEGGKQRSNAPENSRVAMETWASE